YVSNKAISLSDDCPDEPWIPGVVAQNRPQLVYCSVNTVLCLNKYILAPESFYNDFSANKFSWVFQQQDEELHGYALQPDVMPRTPQLTALGIKLKFVEAEMRLQHSAQTSWDPGVPRRRLFNDSPRASDHGWDWPKYSPQ